jgi:hypothetical protein
MQSFSIIRHNTLHNFFGILFEIKKERKKYILSYPNERKIYGYEHEKKKNRLCVKKIKFQY